MNKNKKPSEIIKDILNITDQSFSAIFLKYFNHPGLTVIGGKSATGKTTIAFDLLKKLSKKNKCCFISYENEQNNLIRLDSLSNIQYEMTAELSDVIQSISDKIHDPSLNYIIIDDLSSFTSNFNNSLQPIAVKAKEIEKLVKVCNKSKQKKIILFSSMHNSVIANKPTISGGKALEFEAQTIIKIKSASTKNNQLFIELMITKDRINGPDYKIQTVTCQLLGD
jgi:predicted ATP-dependent serine protease